MKKPITPNKDKSNHNIPGGVNRIPAKAANTGIMHSKLTMPRRPPVLSDSQPIKIVLKSPANSKIAVLSPPLSSEARLTSFR